MVVEQFLVVKIHFLCTCCIKITLKLVFSLHSPGYRDHNAYWIGASDKTHEGDFRWSDGLLFSYTSKCHLIFKWISPEELTDTHTYTHTQNIKSSKTKVGHEIYKYFI